MLTHADSPQTPLMFMTSEEAAYFALLYTEIDEKSDSLLARSLLDSLYFAEIINIDVVVHIRPYFVSNN